MALKKQPTPKRWRSKEAKEIVAAVQRAGAQVERTASGHLSDHWIPSVRAPTVPQLRLGRRDLPGPMPPHPCVRVAVDERQLIPRPHPQGHQVKAGLAPFGGSQFQAGSIPGGGLHPPGESTKPGSEGTGWPNQGSGAGNGRWPCGVSLASRRAR